MTEVSHQRIVRDRRARRPATEHEDRDAVNIAAPVIGLLRRTPTRQYRTDRHHLVEQLTGGPGRPDELPPARGEPLVQAVETVAARVAGLVVGAGDISVE
jgi:hypothetical protein